MTTAPYELINVYSHYIIFARAMQEIFPILLKNRVRTLQSAGFCGKIEQKRGEFPPDEGRHA
jgi:hypothetical protein